MTSVELDDVYICLFAQGFVVLAFFLLVLEKSVEKSNLKLAVFSLMKGRNC